MNTSSDASSPATERVAELMQGTKFAMLTTVDSAGQFVSRPTAHQDVELWSTDIEAWFPQGPEDDSIVLIKVTGDSAESWDTPAGRVASVLSLAKAKATGERYDGGEHETVDLDPAGRA